MLPRASEAFTRAILDGADDIHRHQMRRRRAGRIALAAAALALIAVGLGVALHRLRAPRPDNVLAPNLRDLVAVGATATPEPTRLPSIIDENSGWEYLTDAGPFEEGEWLVLTDDNGCLSYGVYVPFFERAAFDARSVNAVEGMQVQYLGEEEGAFSKVAFADQVGYVLTEQLRRGAPRPELKDGVDYVPVGVSLYVTDALGQARGQFIDNDADGLVALYAVQKLLEDLVPAEDAQPGPINALLLMRYVHPTDYTYPNGVMKTVELRLSLSVSPHGGYLFMDEEGRLYTGSGIDEALFWNIFSKIWDESSVYG